MHETDDVRTTVMRVLMLGEELHDLEKSIRKGLRTGRLKNLEGKSGAVATTYLRAGFSCRRLPPLPAGRSNAYQTVFEEHLIRLQRAGVLTVVSEPRVITRKDGSTVVWVVQKEVDPELHLQSWLSERDPDDAAVTHVWDRILTQTFAAVRDGLGLDARLYNWVVPRRDPQYLGSAVPLLRSAAGREELDLDITFGRAPRWLRGILGSLVLERMRTPYYSPRGVVLDLLADVDRRDLSHHAAPLLRVVNGRLGRLGSAPITEREVVGRRRAAEAVDMLLGAISTLDVTVRKFRRRPPRFLPGP